MGTFKFLQMWDVTLNYTAELWLFQEFATPFKIQRRVQLLMECYQYLYKTLLRKLQRCEPLSIPTLASIARRPAGYDLMAVECRPEKWLKMAEAKQKQNHRINAGAGAVFAVPPAVCKGLRPKAAFSLYHIVPMEIWQNRVALPPGCTYFWQSKLRDWASSWM